MSTGPQPQGVQASAEGVCQCESNPIDGRGEGVNAPCSLMSPREQGHCSGRETRVHLHFICVRLPRDICCVRGPRGHFTA